MRRFEFAEDGAGKFWEIEQQGSDVTVRFGKLGTAGQSKTKNHPSAEAATKDHDALVREKTKKGYAEVGATSAPAAKPAEDAPSAPAGESELDALRADGDELLGLFGELTLLAPGESSAMADHFIASADGAAWQEVFADVEWIADEADGGAVGFWTDGGKRVVVQLDNEGQFRLTGTTLIDHFASLLTWKGEEFAEEARPLLEAFVAAHQLPALRSDAKRAADVKGMKTPQHRFDAAKARPAKAEKGTTKKAAKLPTLGPRPLCTAIASCVLTSGELLVLAGEDTSVEPIDFRLGGRTYLFDRSTLVSQETAPMKPPENHPAHLLPLADGRALLLQPWCIYQDGAWSTAPGEGIRELSTHAKVHALADGSFIAFSSSSDVLAHRIRADGTVLRLGDLPEPRAYDGMVVLPDGRLWFGAGEARGERYFGSTHRTVILDPASWTFAAGPSLPEVFFSFHRGAFAGADGHAMVLGTHPDGRVGTSVWDGQAWSEPTFSEDLARGISDFAVLSDGTGLSVRWTDGAIITFAPRTFELRIAGQTQLGQSGAKVHELEGGRVLFIGGSLYGNLPAEPEIWDRRTGICVPMQGREKDAERQAKQLLKYREKEAAESARTRALMAAQAAQRAAK